MLTICSLASRPFLPLYPLPPDWIHQEEHSRVGDVAVGLHCLTVVLRGNQVHSFVLLRTSGSGKCNGIILFSFFLKYIYSKDLNTWLCLRNTRPTIISCKNLLPCNCYQTSSSSCVMFFSSVPTPLWSRAWKALPCGTTPCVVHYILFLKDDIRVRLILLCKEKG